MIVNDTHIHTPGNTPNLNTHVKNFKYRKCYRKGTTTPTLESAIRCSNSRPTDSAAEATSTGKVYYAEDLPKMDFVAPSIKKQIIEGIYFLPSDPESVDMLLKQEIDKGYVKGPFSSPPFETYRVSPIEIAEGKYSGKKRPILDLSFHTSKKHMKASIVL
ncbi:unnamed protein product [Mytilus edulis]|uniref:Uncharacterized protein n=1 Tax=Mytilus edulis TaxID=6550 RepID=A0A8S3Q6K9_MYTED|nr:unnamed protein product [Mytilus edulis]